MNMSVSLSVRITQKEGLAVASIARDDPSSLPSQCAVNWDRNLKPKLAIMCQCTDRRTLTSLHKREMYILHLAPKKTTWLNFTKFCARYRWSVAF